MVALFETLGFSKTAAKQAVRYKQIDDMEALAELTNERSVFPMELKGDAHEALSLVFRCDGVPPVMIVDNSKEQLSHDF